MKSAYKHLQRMEKSRTVNETDIPHFIKQLVPKFTLFAYKKNLEHMAQPNKQIWTKSEPLLSKKFFA